MLLYVLFVKHYRQLIEVSYCSFTVLYVMIVHATPCYTASLSKHMVIADKVLVL